MLSVVIALVLGILAKRWLHVLFGCVIVELASIVFDVIYRTPQIQENRRLLGLSPMAADQVILSWSVNFVVLLVIGTITFYIKARLMSRQSKTVPKQLET